MNLLDAQRYLRGCHANGRLAHGYLIAGAPRVEGLECARFALQLLFCEAEKRPCGECAACRRVTDRKHPDVLWLEPEKKSRVLSVEQVKDEVRPRMYATAYGGGWKAAVLLYADRLTDEAGNALLKLLEEPPPQTLFLLLAENPDMVLTTVRSRCQQIPLQAESIRLPEDYCMRLDRAMERLSIPATGPAAAVSEGLALTGLLRVVRQEVEKAVKAEAAADALEIDKDVLEARISARYRETRAETMKYLLRWCRDRMAAAVAQGERHEPWLRRIQSVEEMHRRMDGNVPEDVVLPAGLLEYARRGAA